MIVDTSAIIAILTDEPERPRFHELLVRSERRAISAGTLIELTAVLTRRFKGDLDEAFDRFLGKFGLHVAPVTIEQAYLAQTAYRTYGIGSGHPARLNFGDCFAYALSKATGQPLLFKGEDFARTDVAAAATS